MKGKRIVSLAFAAALLGGACGGARDEEGFPPAETLVADSIAVDQVLSVDQWGVYGPYAVITSPKTEKMIFRYRLPGWEFVDTSFAKGEGPDDFGSNLLLQQNNDPERPVFWVSDYSKRKASKYVMTDPRIEKAGESRFSMGNIAVLGRGVVFGDTLVAYRTQDTEQTAHVRTAALADSLSGLDSATSYSVSKMNIQQSGGKIQSISVRGFNQPEMAGYGDRLAVWYPGTENLAVFRIGAGGKFAQEGVYGADPLTREAVDAYVESGRADLPHGIDLLAASQKYLYFFECEKESAGQVPQGQSPKVKSAVIKVYDWQFNPVRKFVPDHPQATALLVDAVNGKIYAYDPALDFEQVYVYDCAL